jgi:hypothetical protein
MGYFIWSNFGKGYEHTGYFNRVHSEKAYRSARRFKLTNPNNYQIRYADVLLMAAKTNNRGGIDDAKARDT